MSDSIPSHEAEMNGDAPILHGLRAAFRHKSCVPFGSCMDVSVDFSRVSEI